LMDFVAAEQQQQSYGDGAECVHQRGTHGGGGDGAQVGAEQGLGGGTEAGHFPGFHAKGFDNAVAGDGLVQDVLDVGQLVLAAAGGVADAAADLGRREQDGGQEKQQHPSEFLAQQDHGGSS